MAEGYIALYRMLLDKPIWQMSSPQHKTVLITLLLMANHEENEWEWMGQRFKVFPGQFVTSLESIAKACGKGISIQNVRSALVRFQKLEFLTNGSTKCGRLITILKWHTYQIELMKGNKDTNREVTKNQQRGNKEVTTNKNDNNDKNKTLGETSSPHRSVINHFCKRFEETTNMKYLVAWGKDGKIVKDLLSSYDAETVTKMIDWYFETDDKWINENGRSIGGLKTSVTKYIAQHKPAAHGVPRVASQKIEADDDFLKANGYNV